MKVFNSKSIAVDVAILIVSFIASIKFVADNEESRFAISPKSLAQRLLNSVLNVSSVSVTAIFLTAFTNSFVKLLFLLIL